MRNLQRWQTGAAALIIASLLAACGGGGGGGYSPRAPVDPGTPADTGSIATDGLNRLNLRRSQLGVPALTRNALLDSAAQHHSDYQRLNNIVLHDETPGNPGFTGVTMLERLNYVGYTFSGSYAYGEVISAKATLSGADLAEELITAIYHRFVIFEPKFKEIGAGAATGAANYTYFTTNFTANNGYGPGLGGGQIVAWPVNGQVGVTRKFLSDFEAPDPVPGLNEVGYPVSVHADINAVLTVTSFTIQPHGGANLNVQLLKRSVTDQHTPNSAAAIVPLTVLAASTTYDVTFTGTINGNPISKMWSFATGLE
ncbi:MAG: CAP domain-containing protein [Pseudomonadota bacterium]